MFKVGCSSIYEVGPRIKEDLRLPVPFRSDPRLRGSRRGGLSRAPKDFLTTHQPGANIMTSSFLKSSSVPASVKVTASEFGSRREGIRSSIYRSSTGSRCLRSESTVPDLIQIEGLEAQGAMEIRP